MLQKREFLAVIRQCKPMPGPEECQHARDMAGGSIPATQDDMDQLYEEQILDNVNFLWRGGRVTIDLAQVRATSQRGQIANGQMIRRGDVRAANVNYTRTATRCANPTRHRRSSFHAALNVALVRHNQATFGH